MKIMSFSLAELKSCIAPILILWLVAVTDIPENLKMMLFGKKNKANYQ